MAFQPVIEMLQESELGGSWELLTDLIILGLQLLQWLIEFITVVGVF